MFEIVWGPETANGYKWKMERAKRRKDPSLSTKWTAKEVIWKVEAIKEAGAMKDDRWQEMVKGGALKVKKRVAG